MSAIAQIGSLTLLAAAAMGQYLRVKTNGSNKLALAGASDRGDGVLDNPVLAADDPASFAPIGDEPLYMVASEAISREASVYAAANGKVAASGTIKLGKALDAAGANNDVIRVLPVVTETSAATGTTNETFTVDSDSTTPKLVLGSQAGGTGDFAVTLKPPATLSAARVHTLPADSDQTLVGATATQTLTNKTLTTPLHTEFTEVVTGTNVIAAAESGSTFFLNSATEFVSTLPAPAAGLNFRFIVTAAPSGASYTIVTNSSANIIKGNVVCSQDAGGTADSETGGGDTISFVDSKAVAGDMVELHCDGTNWFAYGTCKVFDAITITTAS